MAGGRRDEEKKRRQKKRREKKQAAARPAKAIEEVFADLERHVSVPQPSRWPGGCDPSLARPDLVKLDLAVFATEKPPGQEKAERFEDGLLKGVLGYLPKIDHWSWEEFIWHGLPDDSWNPVEAYLEQAGDRYPPGARRQLLQWKEARIGLFEIGDVADETLGLQEWDAVSQTATGAPFRAITLNIGGVNTFRSSRGSVMLTYISPWVAEENLYCSLGYSQTAAKRDSVLLLPYLGLKHPEVVSRPLPWKASRAGADQFLRQWRSREW